MIVNKWIQFAMTAALGLCVLATQLDWSAVLSAGAAAKVAGGLTVAKLLLNALAPAAGVQVSATGGSIITHS